MVLAGQPSRVVCSRGAVVKLFLARAELGRAGDVSPLMLRDANNQGINIPARRSHTLIPTAYRMATYAPDGPK